VKFANSHSGDIAETSHRTGFAHFAASTTDKTTTTNNRSNYPTSYCGGFVNKYRCGTTAPLP
jgi:hypothetical protein